MAVTIVNKHSETAGAVPATSNLQLGEIALQVADGKVFIKTTTNAVIDLMRNNFADGGDLTSFIKLIANPGQNIIDASGNIIGF